MYESCLVLCLCQGNPGPKGVSGRGGTWGRDGEHGLDGQPGPPGLPGLQVTPKTFTYIIYSQSIHFN